MNLSFLSENRSNPALRYRKYHYILQTAGNHYILQTDVSNVNDQTVNRIIEFCSLVGLKMLSESNFHHSDRRFQTKSKRFGQLYVFHAWLP